MRVTYLSRQVQFPKYPRIEQLTLEHNSAMHTRPPLQENNLPLVCGSIAPTHTPRQILSVQLLILGYDVVGKYTMYELYFPTNVRVFVAAP